MWWLLPVEVAQTLAVLHEVSEVIICLILDDLVPQEQPSYVPRKRRGCSNRMHKVFLGILSQCCDSLEACIKNLKVRRRYHPPRLYYTGQRTKRKKGMCTMHTDITGMTTMWANERNTPSGSFDSDSQALMLDDGASACITNNFKDFTDPPKWADRKVKGIKGHAQATHHGTVKWYIEDDHGLVHVMIINGAYLIPEASTRILSPQHLAQQANDHFPIDEGTGALTTSKNITLFWAQRRFTKTVPLDLKTNVGLTTTAPGARDFRSFCATVTTPETRQMNIFTTHVIPDEDDDEPIPDEEDDGSFQPQDPIEPPTQEKDGTVQNKTVEDVITKPPKTSIIDMGPVPHVIPDDQEPTTLDPHDELLRWYYRLGHLPFDRIRQLATQGQLPKHILSCKKPILCSMPIWQDDQANLEGQGREQDKHQSGDKDRPDHIGGPAGVQHSGTDSTTERQAHTTKIQIRNAVHRPVFRVHFCVQKRLTSEETVMAKHAFESSADQRGVKIIHYHADNGRFADNAFIADCKAQREGLSYCGVNAHFQKGIAERRIRDLQEQTRTSMIYAMNKWKCMVLICLWPYAMHHANNVANATPRKGEEQSPSERFSGVNITPKLRHFHAFGCPTYVLDNALQSGKGSPKWKRRSRLGVYLGPSPNHARSVGLVLNPLTGHVSPQFHVKFDDIF